MKDDTAEILEKIEMLIEGESADVTILTKTEVRKLRSMMAAYDMWLAGGKAGKVMIWVIISLAAIVTAIAQLKTQIIDLIRGIVAG